MSLLRENNGPSSLGVSLDPERAEKLLINCCSDIWCDMATTAYLLILFFFYLGGLVNSLSTDGLEFLNILALSIVN